VIGIIFNALFPTNSLKLQIFSLQSNKEFIAS